MVLYVERFRRLLGASLMRKVLFVTGTRSEYDILYSVMRAVREHPETHAGVIVTGAHLSAMYGHTAREIEKDDFHIVARIESLLNTDTPSSRVKSAAIQLVSLIDIINQFDPLFLIAPMDREEAMTVALAGQYMRIPVVHIGGGETADDGNVDNPIRHAVTKLAHLHMVTTDRSAQRVIAMGEEPWRVHVVGAPGLDRLTEVKGISPSELWRYLGYDPGSKPFAVVIQHSIISNMAQIGKLMEMTLDSIISMGIPAFVSYPNSDAGGQQIIAVIETYAQRYPTLKKYQNLPRHVFVNLLRKAHVLVGNSSCGIIEAPMLHLPVVNVGPRQRGREHSNNIQFVDHNMDQIRSAIQRAVYDNEYRHTVANCVNPYGDGHAGKRIAEVLAKEPVNERLLNKKNTI